MMGDKVIILVIDLSFKILIPRMKKARLFANKKISLNTHFSKILFLENLFSTNVLQLLHIGRTHSSKKNKLTPF